MCTKAQTELAKHNSNNIVQKIQSSPSSKIIHVKVRGHAVERGRTRGPSCRTSRRKWSTFLKLRGDRCRTKAVRHAVERGPRDGERAPPGGVRDAYGVSESRSPALRSCAAGEAVVSSFSAR